MKGVIGTSLIGTVLLTCLAVSGCAEPKGKVQRFGAVIGVKKEAIPEYKRLHAETWPGVLQVIRECNIRNYSIFLKELEKDKWYLFAYYEYTGKDIKADMEKMKTYQAMQDWWKLTDPLQEPLPIREKDEWWSVGEEVFHTD